MCLMCGWPLARRLHKSLLYFYMYMSKGCAGPPVTLPFSASFLCDNCALLWPWDCRKGPSTTVRP